MSREMPLIVYVGNEERGERLQQMSASLGWTVLTATQELQALGMYVFYMPDLMIVDSEGNMAGAETVYAHLRSVNAAPILILAEPRPAFAAPPGAAVRVIPSAVEESQVILAAASLLQLELAFC